MQRKNRGPFKFTDSQVQQLKRTNQNLRKLNCSARRELRRIGRTDLTRTQYREAGDLLGTIAKRMIGELRFHHAIVEAEPEQQPLRIVVRFVTPCVDGSESRQITRHDDDETKREALKQDPAHRAEIESLLELTNSIEDLVSRRSMLRGMPLNEFFLRINRFRLAVFEQQQHLLATVPQLMPQVEIQFEDDADPPEHLQ
jgi:hypothetical protein